VAGVRAKIGEALIMGLTGSVPRLAVISAAIVLALRCPAGGAGELERFEFREPHMGTEFKILLYTMEEADARAASSAAFARIAELNARLSDYDPESELSRLSTSAVGMPVVVSDDLFDLLAKGQRLAERSEGAFDVTIGPVGRLWRRARRTRELPEPDALARAREAMGYRMVRLDPEARTVRLDRSGMKLDLGGIAKGYAADEALRVLRDRGIPRALVAAAGDIATGDPPPGEEGWLVEVQALARRQGDHAEAPTMRLANRAVSTSGDAEQSVEIGGVRYSHVLDPRTGVGVVGRSSATVIAPEGATADSLATALSVLGPERGMGLIESTPGAAAYYVRANESGYEVVASSRWPR
jgi:thiamine biosynthesis lipoprotein